MDELADCLDRLRRDRYLSYEAMERESKKLRSWPDGSPREVLGKSTVGEIVTGKRLPSKGKLLTYLTVCRVVSADLPRWLAAWERVRTSDLAQPASAIRVRETSPRRLGVHAAIQVDGAPGELPLYVPRDVDPPLRAALSAGAQQGCFVLLVGGSSVGKTRTLYEAVRITLPEWWLVHPDDSEEIRALAAAPAARTVVWLDELQKYLAHDGGLTAGRARTLLQAGAVLVGTMWPDEYATRISPRRPGGDDQHARATELLDLAHVIDVAPAFSEVEHRRAQELAATDVRIWEALQSTDAGVTQVLAAGPELLRRWEHATNPYGQAVITVAIEARRLDVHAPLTRALLADAIPGYLTAAQRASAASDWLDHALDYATTPIRDAASALTPVDDGTMGGTSGYVAADYLLHHDRQTRHGLCPPASAWQALVDHLDDHDALEQLEASADVRMLYRYSRPVLERLADAGNRSAEIQIRIDQGDLKGAIAEAREWELEGDPDAYEFLIWALEYRGHIDAAVAEVRSRNHRYSKLKLVALLSNNDRLDELKVLAEAGDEYAARRLAFQLARRGRAEEALALVRPQADATPSNGWAAGWVVECLALLDRLDELQARADAGDDYAELRLLARRGQLEEIHSRVAAGEAYEGLILTALLDGGHVDDAVAELRRHIAEGYDNGGDIDLNEQLAELLATHGLLDELKAEVRVGNPCAGKWLVHLLIQQGQVDQANQLRRFGLNPDGTMASADSCETRVRSNLPS
ncbi:hypothetical protein AB0B10_24975 [Micromonospora arborensis]|uniref:hypothetical protein n=1 Tax=Micromonospora arborensis TaxID=2116518 RepID=UPI0033EFF981